MKIIWGEVKAEKPSMRVPSTGGTYTVSTSNWNETTCSVQTELYKSKYDRKMLEYELISPFIAKWKDGKVISEKQFEKLKEEYLHINSEIEKNSICSSPLEVFRYKDKVLINTHLWREDLDTFLMEHRMNYSDRI